MPMDIRDLLAAAEASITGTIAREDKVKLAETHKQEMAALIAKQQDEKAANAAAIAAAQNDYDTNLAKLVGESGLTKKALEDMIERQASVLVDANLIAKPAELAPASAPAPAEATAATLAAIPSAEQPQKRGRGRPPGSGKKAQVVSTEAVDQSAGSDDHQSAGSDDDQDNGADDAQTAGADEDTTPVPATLAATPVDAVIEDELRATGDSDASTAFYKDLDAAVAAAPTAVNDDSASHEADASAEVAESTDEPLSFDTETADSNDEGDFEQPGDDSGLPSFDELEAATTTSSQPDTAEATSPAYREEAFEIPDFLRRTA